MDPQRFTCRKKKNVGTCSFGKKNNLIAILTVFSVA